MEARNSSDEDLKLFVSKAGAALTAAMEKSEERHRDAQVKYLHVFKCGFGTTAGVLKETIQYLYGFKWRSEMSTEALEDKI